MTSNPAHIPEDVGLWIALKRVQTGRVFIQGKETLVQEGRPFPPVLVPFVRQLFEHGHAKVDHPDDENRRQQVRITQLGEGFLLELNAIAEKRLSTANGSQCLPE